MPNNKLMVFAIIIVSLMAVSAVGAANNETSGVASVNTTDYSISVEEAEIIDVGDNQVILEANEDAGTFNELSYLIRNAPADSTLKLEKDYKSSSYPSYISINNGITIDGQNHTIDAGGVSGIFYIAASNVALKNINFVNGKGDGYGGAIFIESNSNSNIANSNFVNCSSQFGGAIYLNSNSNCFISNSNFVNCSGEFGGAIFFDNNVNSTIENSNFEYNVAEVLGGSLLAQGNSHIHVKRTNFTRCSAKFESGGAITFLNTNFNAEYMNVIDCSSEFGGAVTLLSSRSNITHSTFARNKALYYGGAIFAMYGTVNFNGNDFSHNSAEFGGGAYLSQTATSLINNQFKNNSASNGGAVYAITINENSIFGNEYIGNSGGGADFYKTFNDNLTIANDDYSQFRYPDDDFTVLPAYYSLVDENLMSPVKDQGIEGNCWAFAALAALESCILKASDLTLDLSEANMKNLMAHYSNYGYMVAVNNGGHSEMVYGYLASWLGPIFEYDDNYYVNDFLSPLLKSIFHVQNIVFLKRNDYLDNDGIKNAILRYGAVSTSMHYTDESLNGLAYYYRGTEASDHAVCIVGWDDTYSRHNFADTPPGDGAWIVRNSWGPSWGDGGYFYVSYYDEEIAEINTASSFTFILNDTVSFDRVYQLEIQRTSFFNTNKDEACYKNVFTVEGDEYLAAVSTYFEDECDYEISIYLNELLVSTKIGKANAGYYTINLDDPIYLNKNDNVSVVFNCTNIKGGLGKIPFSSKSLCTNLFIKKGISYMWENRGWVDLYSKGGVACIKMFTASSFDTRLNPYFQIAYDGDSLHNDYLINVLLPRDATGLVSINCDNRKYVINISQSRSLILSGLNENNNTLTLEYSGDGKYQEKSISCIVDTSFLKPGTFEELADKILNFNGATLTLNKDYYASGFSSMMDISKAITIDGKGHTLDARHLSEIFNVASDNVVLKNIKFIAADGSAIIGSSAACSIINCTFIDNYAEDYGGAIYWKGNEYALVNCSFVNNSAYIAAGAVYCSADDCTFTNCSFINNSASQLAGALFLSKNNNLIEDCIFLSNSADDGGAIILNDNANSLVNCIFEDNAASRYGGAVYLSNDDCRVCNCSFANSSAEYGGAVFWRGNSGSLDNCSFVDNSASEVAGSLYWMGENGNLLDSTFIDNTNCNQVFWASETNGNIAGCRFINNTHSVTSNGATFIRNNVNLRYSNSSFDFKSPKVTSVYLMNVLEDLPIKSKITFNFVKDGVSRRFTVDLKDNCASICTELADLEVGTWNVAAEFGGDDNYNPCSTTFSITVNSGLFSMVVEVSNATVGHQTTLMSKISSKTNPHIYEGIVTFYDDKSKIGEVNAVDGVASLNYVPTSAGEHTITAVYSLNNIDSSGSAKLFVDSASVEVLAEDGVVGFSSVFKASVKGLYSIINEGYVSFYLGEECVGKVQVVNGRASLNYTPLVDGVYSVKAVFADSVNFMDAESTAKYTVTKADSDSNATESGIVPEVVIPPLEEALGEGFINVKLPSDATGTVTLTVDGKNQTFGVKDGVANVKLPDSTNGVHDYTITYSGDGKYSSYSKSWEVLIKEEAVGTVIVMESTFSRYANDYNAGERGELFYGTLYDVNGNPLVGKTVQITVNGVIYEVETDKNGKAGLAVNLAAANSYTYALLFCGDEEYKASLMASSKLTVVKKPTSIIANNMAFKTNAKTKTVMVALNTIKNPYDGKLYLNKAKTLTLTVNGKTYSAKTDQNGIAKFNIKLTKKGKYSATVRFAGDKTYESTSKKITITISNAPAKNKDLAGVGIGMAPANVDAGGSLNVVGDYSKYLANENVSTSDNSQFKKDTVIQVDQKFTRIANDYSAGERGAYFYATLKDSSGKPLAGKTVQIAVNGPIYKVVTDKNGKAGLQVNLAAANTYTYALSFSGDDAYNPAKLASSKLTVTKKATSISTSNKAFKKSAKTKSVSVTLNTIKNPYDGKTYLKAGKQLTLKVNGKTYTAKTNSKGIATFKITKLTKKGTFAASISFDGDNTYGSCSKSIKITIR